MLGLVLASVLLLTALGGCSAAGITRGNGKMTNGSFSHGGSITKLDIRIPATVHISPEKSSEITYIIDENLKNLVDITYQNGVLKIATKNNRSITSDKIRFDISADALEAVNLSGAVALQGKGTFTAQTFVMDISGAGSVELALNAQSVSVDLSGAAKINLTGATKDLAIDVSGAATVNARDLIAQNAKVKLTGAGSVQVHAQEKLDTSTTGVGSIVYWGNPELSQNTAGITSVTKGD